MSVAVYHQHELEGLWYALGGTPEVQQALGALGYANRAAFLLTYTPDDDEVLSVYASLALDQPRPYAGFTDDALDWADNLLYNCVSNGGSDFAPAKHADAVRAAAIEAIGLTRRRAHYQRLIARAAEIEREVTLAVRSNAGADTLFHLGAQKQHVAERMGELHAAGT